MSRRLLVVAAVIGAVLLAPAAASAHPLGNFTVNTSANLVLSPGTVRVDYVVDLAEIPTVQVRPDLDADDDELVTDLERAAWAAATAETIVANLSVTVDGDPVALAVDGATADLLPGQGGLDVLRLEVTATGATDEAGAIAFADANFENRVGWREVTAVGADGVALTGSSVPTASPTDRLRAYPDDLLSSPLDVREASFAFAPGGTPAAGSTAGGHASEASSRPATAGGAFAGLVGRTGPLMIAALALAFGFGGLHALGPGHGKTLMAAYLVGSGGRLRQAVAVGGAVAIMHTASVLALGFVVLTATETFAPERVYPWLSIGSGLIALGLGSALLLSRLGAWGAHDHHDHGHAHPHHGPRDGVLSRRGLLALAAAGGILPSPTALVVLLAAVALHRAVFGLALIGAFSLGLATALVAVGLVAVRARDAVARRMSSRLARLVPVVSASAIVLLGAALAVGGLAGL
jgi:ABC-type nickel/cobalt efflux system permease component RcnA